jgi:hypothetical protein
MVSQQYIGAIVILLVTGLKMVGVELGTEEITGLVTGLAAVWIAFRRYQKGDISPIGARK